MPEPVVMKNTSWSSRQLVELKELQFSFRGDLTEIAAAAGRTKTECDIALFALIGRSIEEAHIVLNRNPLRAAA